MNNQDFRKTLPNNLDEDETKAIFQTAMDVINRKFPINSTSIEIVDSAYGWTIKKEKDRLSKVYRDIEQVCLIPMHLSLG